MVTTSRVSGIAPGLQTRQFVVLPQWGLRSPLLRADALLGESLQQALASRVSMMSGAKLLTAPQMLRLQQQPLRIVSSLDADGVKLVESTDAGIQALRITEPALRVVPLVRYRMAFRPWLNLRPMVRPVLKASANGIALSIRIVDAVDQSPIRGALVVAKTDPSASEGFDAMTNAQGVARFTAVKTKQLKVEELLVYPPHTCWSLRKRNLVLKAGDAFSLQRIDLSVPDFLMRTYGALPLDAGAGTRIGIVDSGVALEHPELPLSGGAAFVADEGDAGGFGPLAGDHGSHVAGIAAGRQHPMGWRGVAPGAELFSYRVFGKHTEGATNFDIARAIDRAVSDGCDIINLSLGGGAADEVVREAISNALNRGSICVVAAGNDGRQPVSYPAAWTEAVAVSALGAKGTYPHDSACVVDEMAPYSKIQPGIYAARFSNVGPEIDLGGPGVGIVSTVPDGYAEMSGTSMASPAIAGYAAALMAVDTALLSSARDRARSDKIRHMLYAQASPLGLGRVNEGLGMPVPHLGA